MATYVYRCPQCEEVYEIEAKMGEAPDTIDCGPHCGNTMRRVYLPTAVSFKGSGFYRTDNPKTKRVRTQVKV